jgi:amino acid permease
MRHTYRVSFVGEHGLTTFTGVLAILSTIIGGGIVSVPYSFVSVGIPLGILLNVLAVIVTIFSCDLYLAGKDIVPDKPDSLYEIGYMVIGRNAIYMISSIQFLNSFGLMLVYFILFGDTSAQLVANVFNDGNMTIWWCERFFYVLLLGAVLMPVILKKELAELEILSWILFGSIGLFILTDLWQLLIDPNF